MYVYIYLCIKLCDTNRNFTKMQSIILDNHNNRCQKQQQRQSFYDPSIKDNTGEPVPETIRHININYRPVSNLSFLSKLLERAVQTRLQAFIDSNNLMPTTQSAYRQGHSTETAVTKIYNDMLLTADSGQLTKLIKLI